MVEDKHFNFNKAEKEWSTRHCKLKCLQKPRKSTDKWSKDGTVLGWPRSTRPCVTGARPNPALGATVQEFVARSFDFLRETRNKDSNKISWLKKLVINSKFKKTCKGPIKYECRPSSVSKLPGLTAHLLSNRWAIHQVRLDHYIIP